MPSSPLFEYIDEYIRPVTVLRMIRHRRCMWHDATFRACVCIAHVLQWNNTANPVDSDAPFVTVYV